MADADEAVFLWINDWVGRAPLFDGVMEWVVSDYLMPVVLTLTLVGLWFVGSDSAARQRHQIGVLVAVGALALANWTVFIINQLYIRDRPFVDHDISLLFYQTTDPSFPANPAAASFAIATAVWGVNRRVGTALFAVAGLFVFARVYAGVHYPLDVIAGAIIGVVIARLVFRLRHVLEPLPTMAIRAARIFCLA